MIRAALSCWRRGVTTALGGAVLVLCGPGAAMAACDDLLTLQRSDAAGYSIAVVQTGLRAVLRDENKNLSDGAIGPYTRRALAALCAAVPVPPGAATIPATLDLAAEYARLTATLPGWQSALTDTGMQKRLSDPPARDRLSLRLAATPQMIFGALNGLTQTQGCRLLAAEIPVDDGALLAVEKLAGPDIGTSLVEICEKLTVEGTQTDFLAAMSELGDLENRLPGALDDLQDPGFSRWLAEEQAPRLTRLFGTVPAVQSLIVDFRAAMAARPVTVEVTPVLDDPPVTLPAAALCMPDTTDSTLTYIDFTQKDLTKLTEAVDLQPVWDAFAEKEYPTRAEFWDAFGPALAPLLDSCTIDQVRALVMSYENLGQTFKLTAAASKGLALQPKLQADLPLLEPFIDLPAESRLSLETGIEAVLLTDDTAEQYAEVEVAADTLAAASEPMDPIFDIAPEDVDPFDALEIPPVVGVTEGTDFAIANTIENEDFVKALAAGDFIPAAAPEQLKAEVRMLLRPIAKKTAKDQVQEKMAIISPLIAERWGLTERLQTRIAALPNVSAIVDDPTANDLEKRMRSLVGIEYPTYALFEAALREVPPAPDQLTGPRLSPKLVSRAATLALDTAPAPSEPRVWPALQTPDCGCVPERGATELVYAFYPFWLVPPPPDEDAEAEDPAPQPALIDFDLVGRVAFYGLELGFVDPDAPGDKKLVLRNDDRWTEARRSFINSAHRHRAKADVAIDLRHWSSWTDDHIGQAVDDILAQMTAFDRMPSKTPTHIANALPTLFDPVQPDGVTLIFEDYSGRDFNDLNIDVLYRLVNQLHDKLAEKSERDYLPDTEPQTVNIAFAATLIPIDNSATLMQDLYDILIEGRQFSQSEIDAGTAEARSDNEVKDTLIDKILIFLERPTTATKKSLRARMELGDFRGKERSELLRSIIPVLPPGAHQFVLQRKVPNDPRTEKDREFSQFIDDAIYFEDNFSGIGFWPLPRAGSDDARVLKTLLRKDWDAPILPRALSVFSGPAAGLCNWACPNRAYWLLTAGALFTLLALLTWRSFYSGWVDDIAFGFAYVGVVGWGLLIVLAMLLTLKVCDSAGSVPAMLFWSLLAALTVIFGYHFIQKARNGPKP